MSRFWYFFVFLGIIIAQPVFAANDSSSKFASSKYLRTSFISVTGSSSIQPIASLDFNQVGLASWYGPRFVGRKTASGDVFNPNLMTAAHRELPLNSVVRVTNLSNNRSVDVLINDRGPYAKQHRIIDLSKKAAQELGFCAQGIAKVRVEYLHGKTIAFSDSISATKKSKLVSDLEKVTLKQWKGILDTRPRPRPR
jgi:rare lipoprotein A